MSTKESCECNKCVGQCSYTPGWFLPREAEKAAEFLKLSLKEFFDKYLGVNWWEATIENPTTVFVLAPAITNMNTGEEYPADPRGVCVFLKDNKCSIHDAKPFECKDYWHNSTSDENTARHKFVRDAWNTNKNQQQIVRLLGREPIEKDF